MYIAMNRFTVKREHEQAFVTMWKTRDTYLDDVDGFGGFHLLRGPETEYDVVYATHTTWRDESSFRNWVGSEQFKKAHQGRRPEPEMFAAPPRLELFDAVI